MGACPFVREEIGKDRLVEIRQVPTMPAFGYGDSAGQWGGRAFKTTDETGMSKSLSTSEGTLL
jgi:hypothetical protein